MKCLLVVAISLFSVLSGACSHDPGHVAGVSSPNIILVLLDAARADHFSGYGYDRPTTPAIDEIGRRGVVFLNNFVPATETFAVMPLIMSSRYFSRPIFRMDSWDWGIRRETPETIWQDFDQQQILLPALLSGAGYRTAIFHNHPWFVEKTDLVRPFGESFLFPTGVNEPFDSVIIDAVLDWIERHQSEKFFIYSHIMSPHQPYHPKAEDALFIQPGEEAALATVRDKFINKNNGSSSEWSNEELYYFRVMYDSNLAHSDRWIGRLYAGLEKLGLDRNTIFILTADHGELLGEHGYLTHGNFLPWDHIIHTPLIIVWPGQVPAGIRVSGLTEAVDIFPTIIDLAGLDLPPGKKLDGVSLRNLFADPSGGRKAIYVKDAVRTKDYKYMINLDLFFDLHDDPGETNDIAAFQPSDCKEQLKKDYDRFMEPYRQRYEEAIRKDPPPDPFYYPIYVFSLTPRSGYSTFGTDKFPADWLKELPREIAWHLNTSDRRGYLFCHPGQEMPPNLKLTAPLINGDYLVSVLVSPFDGPSPFSPGGKEFQARFEDSAPFQPPISVTEFIGKIGGASYYLDYGPVTVRDNKFSLEIAFNPLPGASFLIHHIKFAPLEGASAEPLGGDALEERVKNLRSLGYVR